jgi:DNA replicative helicase MCM subunit Mcm2 (Cdc46/Mcm family)
MILRKYIAYVKRFTPLITKEARERNESFYGKMRSACLEGGESAAVPITARS